MSGTVDKVSTATTFSFSVLPSHQPRKILNKIERGLKIEISTAQVLRTETQELASTTLSSALKTPSEHID